MAYKLLVVDDDKDITETLQHRLTQEGFVVSVAFDGEEAIEKIKSDDPDIIILDLMLPKKHGFEVLKEVREKFKDRWRPVIILSAKTELESVQKGYSLEADHYLAKPCSFDNLLRGINTMISLIPSRVEE
ncbi:MAG: response regulator [Candidatus Omnitrophota bacterium]